MKTTFVMIATVLAAGCTEAPKVRKSDVPHAVLESFNNNFKDATPKSWNKEEDGNYETAFDWNKVETSATFDSRGKLLETEHEIEISALPSSVSVYVTENYAGYEILEAENIKLPEGAEMYELELKKGINQFDLIFDSNGNFLKKEVEDDDENDKNDENEGKH